jgi:transcriptional regulator with XRE-family HTH domain
MFEPLPNMIRMRREERGLTQEKLARLAGVSRGQLIAFEKGEQNISLVFLIKLAKALELTDLRIGDLSLRPAPPDVTTLMIAGNAIAAAQRLINNATGSAEEVNAAAAAVSRLIDQVNERVEDPGIEGAAARLASTPPERRAAVGRALREVAESPDAVVGARRPKPASKTAARRRAR